MTHKGDENDTNLHPAANTGKVRLGVWKCQAGAQGGKE